MKTGISKLVCLVVFVSVPVAWTFSDVNTVELQSRILDRFDGTPYTLDGVEYKYTWKTIGSKFSTKIGDKTYPIISPVSTAPEALRRQNPEMKSLGIQGAFDRHGYNWIDIYPVPAENVDGPPVEIPLLGRTRFIDMWVWGSNLDYSMEVYIRDNKGIIHTIPMGRLNYTGWRNLRSAIPGWIPMVSDVLPRSNYVSTFVKFRIWTSPQERTYVDRKRDASGNLTDIIPFYVYISQLKVLADIYETVYDGDELGYPDNAEELWSSAGAGAN
jgi:hypothetical protein